MGISIKLKSAHFTKCGNCGKNALSEICSKCRERAMTRAYNPYQFRVVVRR